MLEYIITRLLQMIPVALILSVFVFSILHLTPGDPALIMAGDDAPRELVETLRRQMGLDKPLPVQYWIWLRRMLSGDLGRSYVSHYPIARLIRLRLPVTIHLTFGAMLVAMLISIPGGILSALYSDSTVDLMFSLFTTIGLTVPVFWRGILLLLVFAVRLHWLPPSGFVSVLEDPINALRHLLLPAIALGIGPAAVQIRFIKSAILDVLDQAYVRTARAKGLRERAVIARHVLKNAAIPVVTIMGLQLGSLLAGAVLTESVFGLPGLGRLVVDSTLAREYTVVQGCVLLILVVFMVVNTLVDVCYAMLDPRIRYGKG